MGKSICFRFVDRLEKVYSCKLIGQFIDKFPVLFKITWCEFTLPVKLIGENLSAYDTKFFF